MFSDDVCSITPRPRIARADPPSARLEATENVAALIGSSQQLRRSAWRVRRKPVLIVAAGFVDTGWALTSSDDSWQSRRSHSQRLPISDSAESVGSIIGVTRPKRAGARPTGCIRRPITTTASAADKLPRSIIGP